MAGLDGGTVATILTTLGVGTVLGEVVRQWFVRSGRRLDEAATIRQELRERVRALEERLEQQRRDCDTQMKDLNARLDGEQAEKYALKLHVAILEAKLRDIEQRCLQEHGGFRRDIGQIQAEQAAGASPADGALPA